VSGQATLALIEDIIDSSGTAPQIEALLPAGVRHRQLKARTLLTGMMLTLDDRRPAFLTRIHAALTALPGPDQARLGVTEHWHNGPHQLTYRQTERTFHLIADALATEQHPAGAPSPTLTRTCDDLLEASIPAQHKDTSRSLGADWTDVETFARPPRRGTTRCADPDAAWGHRTTNLPGPRGEMFFGYYLSAATMTREETGPPVPELARRMTLTSCRPGPARALAQVLTRMPQDGIALGDILDDSGYAHRDAAGWAIPLRQAGAQLIQDLHPHDRGPKGTHHGAIIANGNLYCPATPRPLLELGPLAPAATAEQTTTHDQQTTELARHKLGPVTADDTDGYHRVICPAAAGKIRCPLRPGSMTLDRGQPEILTPPGHPPACCTQQTITVPPQIAAKTRQKHDYPSQQHRRSYARRTAAERTFSTIKDPATTTITRGWCRLTGVTPLTLWLTALLTIRNQRILHAWGHPPERQQPPDCRRAPTQNPQTPPHNPRQPRRHPAITSTQPRPTARPPPHRSSSTATTAAQHALTPAQEAIQTRPAAQTRSSQVKMTRQKNCQTQT
jgi:hypothetical protein